MSWAPRVRVSPLRRARPSGQPLWQRAVRLFRRRRRPLLFGAVVLVSTAGAAAALSGNLGAAVAGLTVPVTLAVFLSLRTHRLTLALARELTPLNSRNGGLVDRVERVQRKVLAAVEAERLGADTRHEALLAETKRGTKHVVRAQRDQTREVEALLQLFTSVAPRTAMPSSGQWALAPTTLLDVLSIIDRLRSKTVLELGSGTSTVWFAYALEKTGGRLISLDHDGEFAAQTRSFLAAHGLSAVAEVRDAPLTSVTVEGEGFQWYDPAALDDIEDVDLLIVDGPPGAVGPVARFPAVHLLRDRLSSAATVVLDDASRADEKEILRRWCGSVAGLRREHTILGAHAVLSYERPDDAS